MVAMASSPRHRWEKDVSPLEEITLEEYQQVAEKAVAAGKAITGQSWGCRHGFHTLQKTGEQKRVVTEDITMSVERNISTGLIGRVYTKFFKTATRHQCTKCGAEMWLLSIIPDSYS